MDKIDNKILEAYNQVLINEAGKAQGIILNYLKNLDNKNAEIELSQIASHPSARGVHFGKLQSAAEALNKRGKIQYKGSKVKFLKENYNEDFIDDSKTADKIFKDLRISSNDIIMKVIIPAMQKYEDKIRSKYKLGKFASMNVNNLGSAYIHDILSQLIGEQMLIVHSKVKKISR